MMNLKIRGKISLSMLVVLLLGAITVSVVFFNINQIISDVQEIKNQYVRADMINNMHILVRQQMADIKEYMLTTQDTDLAVYQANRDKALTMMTNLLKITRDPQNKAAVAKIIQEQQQLSQITDRQLVPLVQQHQADQALNSYKSNVEPAALELTNLAAAYVNARTKSMDAAEAMAMTHGNRIKGLSLGLCLVAIILGVLFTLLLVRSINRPVQEIVGKVKAIADGDLTHQVKIYSSDELGEIAQAINQMSGHLREIIQNIMDKSALLTDHSQELAAAGQELTASAQEIAGSTTDISQKSLDQANMAQDVSQHTRDVETSTGLGDAAVKETVAKMGAIHESVNKTAESIMVLQERAGAIGQITQVITQIAGQTNILALNAAIESARAGEQGQGFAVVAEEVRKLAMESDQAAKDIADLIRRVQERANIAAHDMKESAGMAEQGTETVNRAGAALQTILDKITATGQMINQMAVNSQGVSDANQELAAGTQQVSATSQNMAQSVQELAKMADEFKVLIERFKIN